MVKLKNIKSNPFVHVFISIGISKLVTAHYNMKQSNHSITFFLIPICIWNAMLSRGGLLIDKLMLQGFLQPRLMSAFGKFYGRYNDLIQNYKLSFSHMMSDDSAFMELGSRRMWPVYRGCLLLLGIWSHIRLVRGSVLAHLFIWLVTRTCVSRMITL
jgi:hypothetical protein